MQGTPIHLQRSDSPCIGAAILAGGQARRFGGVEKAFLKIDDIPIIDRMLAVLRPRFSEVMVVTDAPLSFNRFPFITLTSDIYRDKGPLCGIHAALASTQSEALFVVACDLPLLDGDVIQQALSQFRMRACDILIPRHRGRIEPLHALYHRRILPSLTRHLKTAEDKRIRAFFPAVHTDYWDVDGRAEVIETFFNINRPEDLKALNAIQQHRVCHASP